MEPQNRFINKLISELGKLPGIGEKTATRLAFFILRADASYAQSLAQSILEVRNKVRICSSCMNISDQDPCRICMDARRDKSIVCVVEEPSDMAAIEKTHIYNGLYHILHGVLSPLSGVGPNDIKIKELLARLKSKDIKEVIIATNPNVEGETTALYLAKLIKPLGIKLTRLASGIPVGGDIEFTDPSTLTRAIEERRTMS